MFRVPGPLRVFALIFAAIVTFVGMAGTTIAAERPDAPHLFPGNTLAYAQVADSNELAAKFHETALGRIAQDGKIKPLVTHLYGSAAEAFAGLEEQVGVSLTELLSVPQGEIAVALVAQESGPPALVALIDVGERPDAAMKLLEKGEAALAKAGAKRSTEKFEGVEFVTHQVTQPEPRQVTHFVKDGTIVAATTVELAKDVLNNWLGKKKKKSADADKDEPAIGVLADNEKFNAIMNRCRGTKDERPQITFFVDPIETAKALARGNTAAQVGLAVLPALGLDGLQGIGGSMILATEDFDMLFHAHLLLDEPRAGVIDMLALKPGDLTPERWVPGDAARYMTLNWDVDKTYSSGAKLYDSFFGEEAFSKVVQARLSEPLGVDFEKEVLPAIDGRVTYVSWIERPASVRSASPIVGVKLKDAKAFVPVLEKFCDKYKERFVKKSYGGVAYYEFTRPELPAVAEDAEEDDAAAARRRRRLQRQGTPCVAIVGDYLIVTDRPSSIEKVVVTKGDVANSLARQLDYKLIASKIRRQLGGKKAGMLLFDRPEENLRMWYEMATAEENRKSMTEQAAENQFFKALDSALTENPLPPFAVISQYLAPSGGVMTNDESGFHYMGFTLKRK
jgi:hypothetical protein